MNNKNELYRNPIADDLDYERINQLIARYSNVSAVQDDTKPQSHSGKSKTHTRRNYRKKKLSASKNAPGQNTRTLHTYAMKNNNYFYKFPNLSDSNERELKDYRPIQIDCYDLDYSCNSDDTDSSLSISDVKRSKEKLIASKSKQVKFQENYRNVDQQTSFPTFPCKKSYAEKTTYCRPMRNLYDKHLVCKIMERNAKLQLLLTKYVITRHKEKEREKWNNYVNMLKIKNRCFKDSSKYFSSPSMSQKGRLVNDSYSAKFNLHQTDSCREMLHDLYDNSEEVFIKYPGEYYDGKRLDDMLKRVYHSQQHCFANTSRVKRNNKHREKPECNWSYDRSRHSPKIVIDDEHISSKVNRDQYLRPSPAEWFTAAEVYPRRANILENRNAQTNITFGGYESRVAHFKNKSGPELKASSNIEMKHGDNLRCAVGAINEMENIVERKENNNVTTGNIYRSNKVSEITNPQMSVHNNLESKLDQLINAFNSFMKERKSNGSNDGVVIITDVDEGQNTVLTVNSKEAKNKKEVTIVGNVMTNTSFSGLESQLTPSHYLLNMRLNKILYEELDKSNKIRSEIEAMLNPNTNRSCAVEISAEIPTRERSTEVTDSLSKTKLKDSRSAGITVEDISCIAPTRVSQQLRRDQRIAVNPDPLGLITLLRFSAEAVRQVLSFVPNLSWYLTSLHRPPSSHDYVCNICGAAFARPSELGAHILTHDLGQARDCSVCRHSVDSRRSSQLFRCAYCGQRFTRAYCCELHQRGCSLRLRNRHPSGALLR